MTRLLSWLLWLFFMVSIRQWFQENGALVFQYPSQIATIVLTSIGITWGVFHYLHKNKIDTLKERIEKLKDQINFTESKIKHNTPQSQSQENIASKVSLSKTEIEALFAIENRKENMKDIWDAHMSPERLSEILRINLDKANDIILELKSQNLVTDEVFSRSFKMIGRGPHLSMSVMITNKGSRLLRYIENQNTFPKLSPESER